MKDKLILGSAGKSHPDAITLDIDKNHNPDIVHDLNITPLPFEDNQFREIIAHHILEHLSGITPLMNELYRICKPYGVIYIEAPHHSSWCANTPSHKLRFSYFAFDEYIQNSQTTWQTGKKFYLIKREITFHRAFRKYFLNKLFNRYPMAYERFWTYIFPAEHFKIWLRPVKN